MIPAGGPRPGAQNRVHERLYDAFAQQLSRDYVVVHRPAWVGQNGHSGPCDGHADFLVSHPDRGILLFDIILGGLAHNPSTSRWTTGAGVSIDNPFDALAMTVVSLAEVLASQPTSLPAKPVMGAAVVLADVPVPSHGFSSSAPRDVLVDRTDIDALGIKIERLFRHWTSRSPGVGNASNRWWVRAFERLFIAPVQVRARLGARLKTDREEMLALDTQQVGVLDMLSRMRNVTVYGPAGTGKTVLAVAKAHSLAQQGLRVLLTCYNKALGFHLRDVCREQSGIVAIHFHGFCFQVLDLKGPETRTSRRQSEKRHFYDEQLPANLIAAASRLEGFDAIVVDEGQDFLPSYWRALEAIGRNGADTIRYIFYDDRQRLRIGRSNASANVPGQETAIVLRTNWRNTQRIHGHIGTFEPPLRDTPCAAPEGVPVWHVVEGVDPVPTLRGVLKRLLFDEGVQPADIVVLTGRARSKSQLVAIGDDLPVVEMTVEHAGNKVRFGTIHAFKGLEAPVVILAELDHLPSEERRRLHYVGASRAMSMLVILSDAEVAGSGV